MKIITRIIVFPFVASLYFVFSMINCFKAMWLFIKYGGTLEINDKL